MPGGAPEPAVPQYPIESVDRTLTVLQQLARHPELRLADVRAHLDVGQSTAHRLMAMLVYRGFAVQDPETRAYRAGPVLAEIGRSAAGGFDVVRTARPFLEGLAATSGETAHLGTLSGTTVRYLDVVESTSALRVTGRVGRLTPAHATSLGKAMLATHDDARVRELYAGLELRPQTSQTLTDLDRLVVEVGRARSRGWARNRGEMESGVCSVGVGLELPGHGVFGLSIATPQVRSSPAVEKEHAGLLRAAAEQLLAAAFPTSSAVQNK